MSAQTIDSRGRRCPLPIIDLAAASRDAADGTLMELIADDPAADADVPAWCRMRGHVYEGSSPLEASGGAPATVYRVRINAAGARP